ncbi:MAG: cohesin domain-containing protein [Candidatus Neomarinimicrobiota bacterium]
MVVYDNPLDLEEAEKKGIELPALVFFPDSVAIDSGDTVTLRVFAMEVQNLGGYHIQVIYDTSKLNLTSVEVGEFFDSTATPMFFYSEDTTSSLIDIYGISLGTDSLAFASGTGNLAHMVFNAEGLGKSTIQFTQESELVTADDNPIEIKAYLEAIIQVE